jgi:hypothetical protein
VRNTNRWVGVFVCVNVLPAFVCVCVYQCACVGVRVFVFVQAVVIGELIFKDSLTTV